MKWPLALLVAALALSGCRGQSPPGTDPFWGRTTVAPPSTGSVPGPGGQPYRGGSPGPGGQPYRGGAPAPAAPLAPPNVQLPQSGWTAPGTAPATTVGSTGRYDPPGGFGDRGPSAGMPASSAGAGDSQPFSFRGGVVGTGQPQPSAAPAATGSSAPTSTDSSPSPIRVLEPAGAAKAASPTTGSTTREAGTAPAVPSGSSPAASGAGTGSPLAGRATVVRTLLPRPQAMQPAPAAGPWPPTVAPAAYGPQPAPAPTRSVEIMELPPARSS